LYRHQDSDQDQDSYLLDQDWSRTRKNLSPNTSAPQSKRKLLRLFIEAVRKWGHHLYSRPFTLITDQRSLAFMFDQCISGKIKNAKIQAWRAEVGMFSYEVKHRSEKENVAADALLRVCSVAGHPSSLVFRK